MKQETNIRRNGTWEQEPSIRKNKAQEKAEKRKQLGKEILHLAWSGISIAFTIYVLIGIVADLLLGGTVSFQGWFLSRSALGAAISGMGFSLPTLIYGRERLAYSGKVVFHLGTGCIVMFLAGILGGWVPFGTNWLLCVVIFFAEVILALIGWFIFSFYYQNLAEQMNQKIREREPEHGALLQEASLLEEQRVGSYKKWSPEMAKRDDFLFFSTRWVLDHPLRNRKEPEWNKLGLKIGLVLLFVFVLFFVVMGSLPDSFFEW